MTSASGLGRGLVFLWRLHMAGVDFSVVSATHSGQTVSSFIFFLERKIDCVFFWPCNSLNFVLFSPPTPPHPAPTSPLRPTPSPPPVPSYVHVGTCSAGIVQIGLRQSIDPNAFFFKQGPLGNFLTRRSEENK